VRRNKKLEFIIVVDARVYTIDHLDAEMRA